MYVFHSAADRINQADSAEMWLGVWKETDQREREKERTESNMTERMSRCSLISDSSPYRIRQSLIESDIVHGVDNHLVLVLDQKSCQLFSDV